MGNRKEAITALEESLRIYPENHNSQMALAQIKATPVEP